MSVPFHVTAIACKDDDEKEQIIGFLTKEEKPENEQCVICYYDSEDEDEFSPETEAILDQTTIYNTKRYCNLAYFDKNGGSTDVCPHNFHTICMYKWVKSCKKFECPLCKAGYDEPVSQIPSLLKKAPECVVTYYANGKIKCEYFKLNDEKHGLFKEYDRYGNLRMSCTYVRNKIHGVQNIYYRGTAKVHRLARFEHGKRHGQHLEYDLQGNILLDCNFADDKYEGHMKKFHVVNSSNENPEIVQILDANYVNGKKHGICVKRKTNGQLKKFATYRFGLKTGRYCKFWENTNQIEKICFYDNLAFMHGMCIEYFEKGQMMKKSRYHHGIQVDRTQEWHSNGNLKHECEFDSEGEQDGLWKEWYRTGNLKCVFSYSHGKMHGCGCRYNEQGKKSEMCEYAGGVANGKYVAYFFDGKNIKSEKLFKNGELNGKCRDYNKSGQLLREYECINGQLTNSYRDYTEGIVCTYSYGKLNGLFQKYNRQGQLVCQKMYKMGRVVP